MEVYVYYRVAAEQAATALQSLELAQAAALREWPGLLSRVLHKVTLNGADKADGQSTEPAADVTFMEIYTGMETSLTRQCAAAVLARLVDEPPGRTSVRHVEYFETLPPAGVSGAQRGPGA